MYTNELNIFYQYKDVTEIENVSNKKIANVCDCFTDNESSVYFGKDRTKFILSVGE